MWSLKFLIQFPKRCRNEAYNILVILKIFQMCVAVKLKAGTASEIPIWMQPY